MHSPFIYYLILYKPLGYFLIFFGLLIEGELVLFTAAFLTQQGAFDLGDMFIVVLGGVFAGDLLWYFVGARLNGTHHFWQERINRFAKPFDRHILTSPLRTIFISKFTYGLHRAILVRSGMLGIAPRDFIKADAASVLIWIGIIGGLGYGASASFLILKHYLRFAEISLFFGLIGFFLILHFSSHFFKKEL